MMAKIIKKIKIRKKDLPLAGLALGVAGLLNTFFSAKAQQRNEIKESCPAPEQWEEAQIVE
jgi:hypothetical protein